MSKTKQTLTVGVNPLASSVVPNWADPLVWTTAAWNQAAFNFFSQQLCAIAMARYRWIDLPEKVDVRFLEWCLLWNGCATITAPPGLPMDNAFAMQAVLGTPNGNDEQYRWRAFGTNGPEWPVTRDNGVVVYDSQTRIGKWPGLQLIAAECANVLRTKQTVRQHMRQPVLITAPREQAQQLHNLTSQIANGDPYVLAYDRFTADYTAQVMPVSSGREDMELTAVQGDLKDVWNLGLAYLGIGVAERKAERQSVSEIRQTDEPTSMMALDGLICRRKACDQLNALTGGHATVMWNQDIESDTFNAVNDAETQMMAPVGGAGRGDTGGDTMPTLDDLEAALAL